MMQLCLTHMIAMYKPQGEEFLKSAAVDVYESMNTRLKQIDKDIKKAEGIEKERLKTEKGLLKDGIQKLGDMLERQKTRENPPTYSVELADNKQPVNIFLRQKFSEQVALRKLIYVSENQISRPVQHALRGCNVIGLTGTATRNTEHVINSNIMEHKAGKTGMDSIKKTGRKTTAEVLYRLNKALPEGLKTPVKTYSLDSDKALEQFKGFAKKNSGYNALINQAGACDKLKLIEILNELHKADKELHKADKRPIIFLNIDDEGKSAKSVMINGKLNRLDSLTPDELKQVKEHGFYYYHTPHARGLHFDLPTGSKVALMLSPTVNANARDQAAYRARELGEGHIVELFISEKQSDKLKEIYKTEEVTVSHVLKTHHNQTQTDEAREDLSAYQLHIQGLLTMAADRCGDQNIITLVDPFEGNLATGSYALFKDLSSKGIHGLLNGFTVKPTFDSLGELKLAYAASAPLMTGYRDEFDDDDTLNAEMLLTLILIGFTQISDDSWTTIENYWKGLDPHFPGIL